MTDWTNQLYFGDNLSVLRELIPDESVDLIYLDPPFNSNATYNVLFKERSGEDSAAQITAFDDTWRWTIDCLSELSRPQSHYLPIVEQSRRSTSPVLYP